MAAWRSGQGSKFTHGSLGGSEFVSWQSHSFKLCKFFFFLVFWWFFALWLVFLYSRCWSFKASRGFCDNVFLVYTKWRTGPGDDQQWRFGSRGCGMFLTTGYSFKCVAAGLSWRRCPKNRANVQLPVTLNGRSEVISVEGPQDIFFGKIS